MIHTLISDSKLGEMLSGATLEQSVGKKADWGVAYMKCNYESLVSVVTFNKHHIRYY